MKQTELTERVSLEVRLVQNATQTTQQWSTGTKLLYAVACKERERRISTPIPSHRHGPSTGPTMWNATCLGDDTFDSYSWKHRQKVCTPCDKTIASSKRGPQRGHV
jgi:hypothetical protein